MTVAALGWGLIGLLAGNLLNWLIVHQVRPSERDPANAATTPAYSAAAALPAGDDAGVPPAARPVLTAATVAGPAPPADTVAVAPPARAARDWLPLAGVLHHRNWLALAVELTTAAMTVVLFVRYGLTLRFAVLWLFALVLIDTGAVDWQIKLIDVLALLGATVLAVVTAPLRDLAVLRSLEGLGTGLLLFMLFFVLAKLLYPGQGAPFGLGDVYLGMFIGALVGFFDLPAALFFGMGLAGLASLAMILVLGFRRARHIAISYGTYLCLGALLFMAIRQGR